MFLEICTISLGFKSFWVTFIAFSIFVGMLVLFTSAMITKATDNNERPDMGKTIITASLMAFFISAAAFLLITRGVFRYELSMEDYTLLKEHIQSKGTQDVLIGRLGTKVLLCGGYEDKDQVNNYIVKITNDGYVTYDEVYCLSKKMCIQED